MALLWVSLSARRAWIEIACRRATRQKARSLSARRAWIEIIQDAYNGFAKQVALRKESVDRNAAHGVSQAQARKSLSARRAWIEMRIFWMLTIIWAGRSPQGERG